METGEGGGRDGDGRGRRERARSSSSRILKRRNEANEDNGSLIWGGPGSPIGSARRRPLRGRLLIVGAVAIDERP
jgi:hypothetical protein